VTIPNEHLAHEVVGVKRAIAIMSDWPIGRVRSALKLGAPKHAKGVRPHDLRVWAAEQEARLAIQPIGVTLVGAIVPTAGGLWLPHLVAMLSEPRLDEWKAHECMGWPTKNEANLPPHYRVRLRGDPPRILVGCGKCRETRISVLAHKAWPCTLRCGEPETAWPRGRMQEPCDLPAGHEGEHTSRGGAL
jgi:hypothetical protein